MQIAVVVSRVFQLSRTLKQNNRVVTEDFTTETRDVRSR